MALVLYGRLMLSPTFLEGINHTLNGYSIYLNMRHLHIGSFCATEVRRVLPGPAIIDGD